MLKYTWKIMTFAVLLLTISGWAMAGNLEPPSGPAPTMKSLQEIYDKVAIGTEITSLPRTIYSSGFYYITQDLTCPSSSNCITIAADNVTLDLMGFSLIGPGGTGSYYNGVRMFGRTNVEIRNGTVMNFPDSGIYVNGGEGLRIINVRAVSNERYGFFVYSKGNLIKDCTALSNRLHGFYIGEGSTVTGNTAHDNISHGIGVLWGSTVSGNTAFGNRSNGISAGSGSTVIGNTAYDNSGHGIYALTGSTVIGNTTNNNSDHGIFLFGNNLADQNTAINNAQGNINSCPTCTIGTNHAP